MDVRRAWPPRTWEIGETTSLAVGHICSTATALAPSRRPSVTRAALLVVYSTILLTVFPTELVVATDCLPLPDISHGNITYHQASSNSSLLARIICDINYRLIGSDIIMCLHSGSWNDTVPSCKLVLCEALPTIPNGEVLHSGTVVGSTANYTCIKGFRMVGSARRVCLKNGTWTSTQPQCKRIVCKHPGTPADGMADPPDVTDYPAGTTISYSCRLGYSLNGSSFISCTETGSWTSFLPKCIVTDCGLPPNSLHAIAIFNSTLLEDTVTYVCEDGYTSIFNTSLVCAVNASWTGVISHCTEILQPSTTELLTTSSSITTSTSTTDISSPSTESTSKTSVSHHTSTHSTTATSTFAVSSSFSTFSPASPSTASSYQETTLMNTPSTTGADLVGSGPIGTGPSTIATSTVEKPSTALSDTTTSSIETTSMKTIQASTSDSGYATVIDGSSEVAYTMSSSTSYAPEASTSDMNIKTSATTALQNTRGGASSKATSTSEKISAEKLGIIIGIVIGSVLPVVLIAGMCFLCRQKRNRGAYEVRYNPSPKEETAIMIESPKAEVYGNGHVMGNGHDNHVTLWSEESHATYAHGGFLHTNLPNTLELRSGQINPIGNLGHGSSLHNFSNNRGCGLVKGDERGNKGCGLVKDNIGTCLIRDMPKDNPGNKLRNTESTSTPTGMATNSNQPGNHGHQPRRGMYEDCQLHRPSSDKEGDSFISMTTIASEGPPPDRGVLLIDTYRNMNGGTSPMNSNSSPTLSHRTTL